MPGPYWGDRRELNPRDRGHNPMPISTRPRPHLELAVRIELTLSYLQGRLPTFRDSPANLEPLEGIQPSPLSYQDSILALNYSGTNWSQVGESNSRHRVTRAALYQLS